MKFIIVVCALLVAASASPAEIRTFFRTAPITSQYHSQDDFGQYAYGYNSGLSTKVETKTLDGVTRGSYSYIDSDGELQTVEYVADALNGFRVAATNLPKAPIDTNIAPEPIRETPEVVLARAEHLAKFNEEVQRIESPEPEQPIIAEVKQPIIAEVKSIEPIAPIAKIAPIAPIAPLAPILPLPTTRIAAPFAPFIASSPFIQLRSSEPSAAFSYGYQTIPYTAPAFYSSLPLHHNFAFAHQPAVFARAAAPLTFRPEPLVPVSDTAEVAAAKAEHLAAVEEQKAKIAAA